MDIPVNYLAITVAALAAFVFGFLVHGPILGQVWMDLMEITPAQMAKGKKEMQGKMPLYMLGAIVQQLIIAFVIAHFVQLLNATDPSRALQLAFWSWLGFVAATRLDGVLWEQRKVSLYLFNVLYYLASFIIMTMIIGLWR